MSSHAPNRDLSLSVGERAIAKVFRDKYKLKWPFAAHLAKDAICVLELERLKADFDRPPASLRDRRVEMDTIDLEAIEARANAAASGPWQACGTEPMRSGDVGLGVTMVSNRHKHGACNCGMIWSVATDTPVLTVAGGAWGDTWPAIRILEDGQIEAFQDRMDYGEIPRETQAATMKFIEAARTDVPLLIAEIRRLRDLMGHP